MKKKLIIIILVLLVTCGCVNIHKVSIDELINTTINSKYKLYNHVNSGYKYYLPRTLKTKVTDEYNEIIMGKYYDYYLYVDLVAYYNKKPNVLEENNSLYYSKIFEKENQKGIVDVKELENEEYLIRVIYNYAKVEVKCKKNDLNDVITNALVITSSITYYDDVVASLLSLNDYTGNEEQVNIFKDNTVDNNILEEFDDTYKGNEEEDYDPDVIKERS